MRMAPVEILREVETYNISFQHYISSFTLGSGPVHFLTQFVQVYSHLNG